MRVPVRVRVRTWRSRRRCVQDVRPDSVHHRLKSPRHLLEFRLVCSNYRYPAGGGNIVLRNLVGADHKAAKTQFDRVCSLAGNGRGAGAGAGLANQMRADSTLRRRCILARPKHGRKGTGSTRFMSVALMFAHAFATIMYSFSPCRGTRILQQ